MPVLWLFAISGATGLVYEVVWRRLLMLTLGGAAWATAITLSAFMAGLGIGAIVVGRLSDRLRNPLRWYGWAEIAIGGYALVFPLLVWLVRAVHDGALGTFESRSLAIRVGALVAAFIVLLPPTFLMGGTFPLLVRHYLAVRRALGRGVRDLYFVNTAGAVVGTVLAGFVLLRFLGARSAGWAAAAAGMAAGLVALMLSRLPVTPEHVVNPRRTASKRKRKDRRAKPDEVAEEGDVPPWQRPLVLVIFALSGLAALSYEVLWARIMVFLLGNSTHSFAIMLSSFLLGIALGSWLVGFVGEDRPVLKAALVELLIAVTALLTLFVSQSLDRINSYLAELLSLSTYGLAVAARYILAFVIMLPTAVLFGAVFPLLVRASARVGPKTGGEVGWAYAANTFGAILGPIAAMLFFIRLWGLAGGVVATSLLNLALGLGLLAIAGSWEWKRKAAVAVASVVVAGLLVGASPRQLAVARRCRLAGDGGARLVYYREAPTATVAVFELRGAVAKVMEIDGVSQVPTDADSMQVFRLLGHLPFLVRDDVRDVLVTAFGGGITLGAVLTHPVERVEAVEICPAVFSAARLFERENGGVFDDPRLRVVLADANSYVRASPRRYDAIISDATHPGAAESWVLYTREFYANCKSHLRPGGVMCQWVPLHGLHPRDFRTILRTFRSVFPHPTLWFSRGYAILLATERPLSLDADRIRRLLADAKVGPSLRSAYLDSPIAILKNLALTEAAVAGLAADGPLASENYSPLEFLQGRAWGQPTVRLNCDLIGRAAGDFVEVRGVRPDEKAALDRALRARGDYYRAAGLLGESDFEAAVPLLRSAADAMPGDTDILMYARAVVEFFARCVATGRGVETQLDDIRAIVGHYPEDWAVQMRFGRALLDLARGLRDKALVEEGLSALLRLTRRFPDHARIQLLAAQEFFRFRQFATAEMLLERAVAIDPDNALAWSNLASCYLAQGRRDLSLKAVERALEIKPDFRPALNLRNDLLGGRRR